MDTHTITRFMGIYEYFTQERYGLFGRYFQRNAYTHKYVSHSLYLSLPLYVSQSLSFHLFPLLFVCFSYSVCLSLPFHAPIPCSFSFVDPYLMCVCMYMYVCESAFFLLYCLPVLRCTLLGGSGGGGDSGKRVLFVGL